jgi:hypothetical protein
MAWLGPLVTPAGPRNSRGRLDHISAAVRRARRAAGRLGLELRLLDHLVGRLADCGVVGLVETVELSNRQRAQVVLVLLGDRPGLRALLLKTGDVACRVERAEDAGDDDDQDHRADEDLDQGDTVLGGRPCPEARKRSRNPPSHWGLTDGDWSRFMVAGGPGRPPPEPVLAAAELCSRFRPVRPADVGLWTFDLGPSASRKARRGSFGRSPPGHELGTIRNVFLASAGVAYARALLKALVS